MYQNYAEPLVMHTMKLSLFHVSDYRAEGLITSTWEAIFADGQLYLAYRGSVAQHSITSTGQVQLAWCGRGSRRFGQDDIWVSAEVLSVGCCIATG